MNTKKKHIFLLFATLMLVFAMSITSSAKVKINKTKTTVYVGKSVTLKVSGAKSTPVWTSSDTEVATVTKKGKVVGRGKGTAVITAKVNGKTLKCKVTVKTNISLSTHKITLRSSSTVTITVNQSTSLMYTVSNKNVCKCSWTNEWDAKLTKTKLRLTPKKAGTATVSICSPKNTMDAQVIKVTVPKKR